MGNSDKKQSYETGYGYRSWKIAVMISCISILLTVGWVEQVSASGTENNNMKSASVFVEDYKVSDELTAADEKDYYKFWMTEDGKFILTVTSCLPNYNLAIYGEDGRKITAFENNRWDAAHRTITNTHSLYLKKGAYYLRMSGNYADKRGTVVKSYGKYQIQYKIEKLNEDIKINPASEGKSGSKVFQSTTSAYEAEVGKNVSGVIYSCPENYSAYTKKEANYTIIKFSVPQKTKLQITVLAEDAAGNIAVPELKLIGGKQSWREEAVFAGRKYAAGTYYLYIKSGYGIKYQLNIEQK